MIEYLGKKVRTDVHDKTKKCTENCALFQKERENSGRP